MNKKQRKAWNRYIYNLFPGKHLKEETRRLNKNIDNKMPVESNNNEWRVLVLKEKSK